MHIIPELSYHLSFVELAEILPDSQSKLRSSLSLIPTVDVAVVNVEYEGEVVPKQWREVTENKSKQ